MKVNIGIADEHNHYTNDDTILAEITVLRDHSDQDLEQDIKSLYVTLACEGLSGIGTDEYKCCRYFTSPNVKPEPFDCQTLESRNYYCRLKFPCEDDNYPNSIQLDETYNGIQWFLQAKLETKGGSTLYGKHSCTFVQTGPLPNLLSLVDIEHAETIDDIQVDLITSHAIAGLPQSPLSAGIGLCVECSQPNAFEIKRLRLLLLDTTEINIGDHHKVLPTRRWLLSSAAFDPPIPLKRITNLDKYTRDVQIDHASLAQSFESDEFIHSFELVVEVILESTDSRRSRKVVSVSPVTVLPRIAHTFYTDELTRTASSEIAYVTDSSEEEEEEEEEEQDHKAPNTYRLLAKEEQVYERSSPSSGSIKSFFSDPSTKLDLEVAVHALSFS